MIKCAKLQKLKCFPASDTVDGEIELAAFLTYHSSLLTFMLSDEAFKAKLNQFNEVLNKIEDTSMQQGLTSSDPQEQLSQFKRAGDYMHFVWPESAHPLELLNKAFYGGITNLISTRNSGLSTAILKMYLRTVTENYVKPIVVSQIDTFVADELWSNDVPYTTTYIKQNLSGSAASYTEQCLIQFLAASPLNQNQKGGKMKIDGLTKDDEVKFGCAFVLNHLNSIDPNTLFPFTELTTLAGCKKSICDLATMLKIKNDPPIPAPRYVYLNCFHNYNN